MRSKLTRTIEKPVNRHGAFVKDDSPRVVKSTQPPNRLCSRKS